MRKFVAPEVMSGPGSHRLAGASLRRLGARRALVVSDPGVRAAGWTSAVCASLDEAEVPHVLFTAVTSNPRAAEVAAGAALYARERCNAIVAVGGGSPIDCAKGIGILAANGGEILDYEGIDRIPAAIPPLVCVPTTAGSGADVSQFAIVSDPAQRTKIAIVGKTLVPDLSLLDPLVLTTQPAALTAATGVDTLCHAVEACVSTAAAPITDLLALDAIRLVVRHLPEALARPADLAARAGTLQACLHAGIAFSNASLGAVHAMAHALGGLKDLPHGDCNAILLPHVVEWNFEAAPERYRAVAEAMGAAAAGLAGAALRRALTGALRGFIDRVGGAPRLREVGVRPEDLPDLARKAVEDPCMATNPRCPSEAEVRAIYEAAL
ncbi:iron-containing alcohol dehydrogenase [Anaeromyxobacter paludicola]|uniref:iron-containing alcohol dehydrogenase n=1 Tax=Anaeromyxobacter paludicola TaxID=2918171 RepID=UPI0020BFDD94|nr:iron-containing alcohol dehydrogenase [Anaeromyxobacter paludicola]